MRHVGRPPSSWDTPEQIIFDEIILSGNQGISKKDLLQRIHPVNQSTVYRDTKSLEEDGLIKIVRKGQRTRYFAISSPRKNLALGAYLLGRNFVGDYSLLGNSGIVLCDHAQTDPQYIDFSSYRQFFEPKFPRDSALEKIMFEFSNQIGAFITYIFIQAMSGDNIKMLQLLDEQQGSKRREAKKIARKERKGRFTTEEWIKNSVCSNLVHMLWRFNHMLKPLIRAPDVQTKRGVNKRKKLGPYQLEKKTIDELLEAFDHVYPYLNHELERLRNSLSTRIKAYQPIKDEIQDKAQAAN
jgi:DNA-binding transcriptional ArsR family regulator